MVFKHPKCVFKTVSIRVHSQHTASGDTVMRKNTVQSKGSNGWFESHIMILRIDA